MSDFFLYFFRFLVIPLIVFIILAFIETRYLKYVEKKKYKKIVEDLKFYKRAYFGLSDRIDDIEDYLKDTISDYKYELDTPDTDINDDYIRGKYISLSCFIDKCFDYLWSEIDD